MSFAVNDAVSATLHAALDGISLRQRVIADNIANVDTPGFRATSVDFETRLRAAVADGSVEDGRLLATTHPTQTPIGANGNNVDLRKETLAAMQSQFQFQIMTRAVSDRMALVRYASGAQ
ncbi:flagellar basal body rod protein FlgB [Nocardioides sp.]|uniref:flagellar basal body rod protein FlgB n=1 Tax=Nocardioides sp. TaxID=35761 RepID=UPI00273291D0|nr:flagellar basal body rod protein FlgB [Nocardioides sp.]MDP3890238.1 flagellar basal body rod protein FlgB [Nocardioides sp.]